MVRFSTFDGVVIYLLFPAGLLAQAPSGAPVLIAESSTARIVREVQVAGTVTSPRTASLSTQIGGMVARITVEEGDPVEPGQVLVELDRELAEFATQTAEAQQERAEAALADARRRLEEGRELVRDRTIPQSDFEGLVAEVAIAEADVAAAQASALRERAVLERHRIRAPFAGVISRRVAEVGEWISPGVEVLELVAVDGLRLDFRVAQELFVELSRETAVTISLDAQPSQRFAGRITAIVPVNDPVVRTFLLRVVPADEGHPAIRPGMSAHAVLRIDTGRTGVVVPRDALLQYPDGRVAVWVLERGAGTDRVSERRVRLGVRFGDLVEIVDGLEDGVAVVVAGNETLQEGQAVSVRDAG